MGSFSQRLQSINMSETDEDEKKVMEEIYKKMGLSGIQQYCQEKIDRYKKQSVKIAITGQSGAGKSSLINRLRNLTPDDKDQKHYAAVGVTETTARITEYEFPDNPLLKLYDLPGAGTANFPIDSYARDTKFEDYDAFVILTKDRFMENDKRVATMIGDSLKKPFFFARSKMDNTFRDEAEDKGEDFDPKETEQQIRKKCIDELDDRETATTVTGEKTLRKIYLLSKVDKATYGGKDIEFPDNDLLKVDILKSLNGLQKTALAFSIKSASEGMLEMKVAELKARIKWCALASAAGGAVPVPGVSAAVDMGLMTTEAYFQKKQLLIDSSSMEKHKKAYGEEFHERIKAGMDEGVAKYIQDAAKLLRNIMARVVASEATEIGFKAIPILGSVIGAGLSAGVTASMLHSMLNSHQEIAFRCLEVIKEMEIEKRG